MKKIKVKNNIKIIKILLKIIYNTWLTFLFLFIFNNFGQFKYANQIKLIFLNNINFNLIIDLVCDLKIMFNLLFIFIILINLILLKIKYQYITQHIFDNVYFKILLLLNAIIYI